MTYLTKYYPDLLKERYGLEIDLDDSDWLLKAFDHIAQKRKIKLLRGETDYDRVIQLVFSEIYDGSIGKVTWAVSYTHLDVYKRQGFISTY